MRWVVTAAMMLAGMAGAAHADVFQLNFESPGVEATTATFTTVGVETFDTRTAGAGFTTDFGTGGAISATYSAVQIDDADRYGGAGGTGKYPVAFFGTPFALHFTTERSVFPHGVNYFGYWLSALDGGNQVAFYRNGTKVGALSPADVLARIGGNRAYFGNPDAPFAGQNRSEPYVFINFYDTTGSFDEVRFKEDPQRGGYESDNHTVGYYTAIGGTPEPSTWAMLLAGFGLVGGGLRRRDAATSPAA